MDTKNLLIQYPTIGAFYEAFHERLQLIAIRDEQKFLIGNTARICDMVNAYGQEATKRWINGQMMSMRRHRKANSEETNRIDEESDEMLLNLFWKETASVFILFVAEMRAGKLGKVYGAVDVNAVVEASNAFKKDLWKRKTAANDYVQREMTASNNVRNVEFDDGKVRGLDALKAVLMGDDPVPNLAYMNISERWGFPMSEVNIRAAEHGKQSRREFEERHKRIKSYTD